MHRSFKTWFLGSLKSFVIKTYEGEGIENVDEHRENLPMEVGRQEGAERAEEHNDRYADGQIPPGLGFGSRFGHELAPEES